MKEQIFKIKPLNESFVKINHKSGLTIFLKPTPGFSSAVAVFCTRFGSVDNCFKKNNKTVNVFDGVAHYLEHKLFENEDGTITFELFSNEKALANAQTSFNYTSYYFSSPCENFLNSLKILLNFVQTPYFTKQNVEKERGIIEQEIKMNEDDPYWVNFFNCLDAMYENSSVAVKIAGDLASIKKIDEKLLYCCYENFYCLNNMALVVTGNFNPKQVLNLLEKELKLTKNEDVERIFEKEPLNVKQKLFENYMPVQTPIFSIGFKLTPTQKEEEILKIKIGLEILKEIIFEEGSNLYRYFSQESLVVGAELDFEIIFGRNYFAFILTGESKNPKKVLEKISQEIFAKQNNITQEEFVLAKKTVYKEIIKQLSTPLKVAEFLTEIFVQDLKEIEILQYIVKFSLKDCEFVLKKLGLSSTSLSITWPLKV